MMDRYRHYRRYHTRLNAAFLAIEPGLFWDLVAIAACLCCAAILWSMR